jgi:PIN domain nuclease of toxin-antitoxin system
MRLLLDTHYVLWTSFEPARLSPAVAELIAQPSATLHFSVASMWEIAIKANLKRPDLQVDPKRLRATMLANGYVEVEITSEHALAAAELPLIHRDPFDRLLVAQAMTETMELITQDKTLGRYPGPIRRFD